MWKTEIKMQLTSPSFAGSQHADESEVTNETITSRKEAHEFLDRILNLMGVPEEDK